ncbi:MAG: M61 family metallopeptidase [Fimbriimonas ginsengisoli]|uniref:M61 family metallopeptidase n=1 Tax=Fimbriimonas ginsengisoli TaxID=1005039 RepID=A0A931PUH5_FIMGI|nr:M61 family metallopeptidase [Fimbriimonas ginsengisoli]
MLALALSLFQAPVASGIQLEVDAGEIWRGLIHVRETVAVTPGPLTLRYPKWIQGHHTPSGPINNVVNLHFSSGGKELDWQRDDIEMFEFHLVVPAGQGSVEVKFDEALAPGSKASAKLARLDWNEVLFTPAFADSNKLRASASVRPPVEWQVATPLAKSGESGGFVEFAPVSVMELIDSPAILGRHYRQIPLGAVDGAEHYLECVGDTPASIAISQEDIDGCKRLVREANALFGAHHYRSYRFLMTMSDKAAFAGLEHHECSEDGIGERDFIEKKGRQEWGGLLGHEFTHSWNGKYRRPEGLATPEADTAMKGRLLWVYEGLTQHLGNVLPARAGIWTSEEYRDSLAAACAEMAYRTGRTWRSVEDTAVAVQLSYSARGPWRTARRTADYYTEADVIWLEVDAIIREQSGGKKSLDDFCHLFHGGTSGPPEVKPYSFDDVVATLNQVAPYDWSKLLTERFRNLQPTLSMAGLEAAGWRLAFNDKSNEFGVRRGAKPSPYYSLGLNLGEGGEITDIVPNLPADKAGLAPGMKLVAVEGRVYSEQILEEAIKEAQSSKEPIEILANLQGFLLNFKVDYHGGIRYPHLERLADKPDLLSEMIKPAAKP